jgi:DNA-directed RNA polymerase subunit alpha
MNILEIRKTISQIKTAKTIYLNKVSKLETKLNELIEQEFKEELKKSTKVKKPNKNKLNSILKTEIWDLNISYRARNCCRAANLNTIGDLINFELEDLMRFRNFGLKSLQELEEVLIENGLSFGMNNIKIKK